MNPQKVKNGENDGEGRERYKIENEEEEDEDEGAPLLPRTSPSAITPVSRRKDLSRYRDSSSYSASSRNQAILLSLSLFLILQTFWLLDSLKDPIFAILSTNLQLYQPTAKMISVLGTLVIVIGMEVTTSSGSRSTATPSIHKAKASISLFRMVGIPYIVAFALSAIALNYHPDLSILRIEYDNRDANNDTSSTIWSSLVNGVNVFNSNSNNMQGNRRQRRQLVMAQRQNQNRQEGRSPRWLSIDSAQHDDEEDSLFSESFWSWSNSMGTSKTDASSALAISGTISDENKYQITTQHQERDDSVKIDRGGSNSSRVIDGHQKQQDIAYDNETPSPLSSSSTDLAVDREEQAQAWHTLGYIIYFLIESFGSIMVATFWSFTNSSLDLISAERYYGMMIAIAQIGAIVGSTLSTQFGRIRGGIPILVGSSCFMIIGIICLMYMYGRIYSDVKGNRRSSSGVAVRGDELTYKAEMGSMGTRDNFVTGEVKAAYIGRALSPSLRRKRSFGISSGSQRKRSSGVSGGVKMFVSGVFLILRHNYVLLILGVSCLYEVALTCLDYEMKLVGLNRFRIEQVTGVQLPDSELQGGGEQIGLVRDEIGVDGTGFTTFMGHYGQLTNMLSLFLSFFGFPFLMRKVGLRLTLRLFPTVLLAATILIFALPPNLWLIFSLLALLKAMTYSINDPAKEILYIPTSYIIKLKAKFWIDVVGARVAKAVGSSITKYAAGSTDRIVQYGSVPSVATCAILLLVSVRAGREFDKLVSTGEIVGENYDDDGCGDSVLNSQRVTIDSGSDEYRPVQTFDEGEEGFENAKFAGHHNLRS